jgi:uncharacterized membrane protein YozB (DUF420 family)
MTVYDLPAVNATFNLVSALLLLGGYWAIRKGHRTRHRNLMFGALLMSALFLATYLIYHYQAGSKAFQGTGVVRYVYFAILLSHTILATAIVPMVAVTVVRALRQKIEKHRAIARWTLPMWLYVSVTGVVVYLMLYQLF